MTAGEGLLIVGAVGIGAYLLFRQSSQVANPSTRPIPPNLLAVNGRWSGSGGTQAQVGGVFAGGAVQVASSVPGGKPILATGLKYGGSIAVGAYKVGSSVVSGIRSIF